MQVAFGHKYIYTDDKASGVLVLCLNPPSQGAHIDLGVPSLINGIALYVSVHIDTAPRDPIQFQATGRVWTHIVQCTVNRDQV